MLICQGLSSREIAERLTLSVRTVESHVYRAMLKTGTTSRDEPPPCDPAVEREHNDGPDGVRVGSVEHVEATRQPRTQTSAMDDSRIPITSANRVWSRARSRRRIGCRRSARHAMPGYRTVSTTTKSASLPISKLPKRLLHVERPAHRPGCR